jgi:uncharacterized cupin superfamily protein
MPGTREDSPRLAAGSLQFLGPSSPTKLEKNRKQKGEDMKIEVHQPTEEDLEGRGVSSWPIWEKEVSRFDWHYDATEECYLLEGRVVVEKEDGEKVEFGKGDFVTFPEGLSCVWDVKEPVKKHYNFR